MKSVVVVSGLFRSCDGIAAHAQTSVAAYKEASPHRNYKADWLRYQP